MSHPQEVKSRACELYRGGTSRREISELTDVPLKTVQRWTASVIICPVCGDRHRTINIQRKYCSSRCRSKAHYLRSRERIHGPRGRRICSHCATPYLPWHGNAKKYCSKPCYKRAFYERQKRDRAIERVRAERVQFRRSDFTRAVEFLLEVRRRQNDMRLDAKLYRAELDTIEKFLAHGSPTGREFDAIQDIFNSVK